MKYKEVDKQTLNNSLREFEIEEAKKIIADGHNYIFVGKNAFEIESAFVGSEKEWALTDCDRTYSSDHCPVMAEVNLVH